MQHLEQILRHIYKMDKVVQHTVGASKILRRSRAVKDAGVLGNGDVLTAQTQLHACGEMNEGIVAVPVWAI
jgi:hypothetical protein